MHDNRDPFRAPARESMGPRKLEVARVRITDEGRRVLAEATA
jgi:hypothetical protein